MTDKTITNGRVVGGDYFSLIYVKKSNHKLNYYLDKFNINNYYCYKSSNLPKEVSYEDFLKFEYVRYIFFKKELYDKKHINNWIEYMKSIGGIRFLHKPVPPFNPYKKIIIK